MPPEPIGTEYGPIIDAHTHIGERWPDQPIMASVDDCIRLMDLCGVERSISSASRHLRFDFRAGNRMTHDVVKAHPDRVIGQVLADPRRPEATAEELERYLGGEGFRGIKLHCSHSGVAYDDSSYDGTYERAVKYKAAVLAHTFSPGEVGSFLNAARRYPDAAFVVGHSGGYRWADTLGDIAAAPNAYLDLCCSCLDAGRVEAFVTAGGADRVLFGSDNPMLHPATVISEVVNAHIDDEAKRLILGGNALRLIGEAE